MTTAASTEQQRLRANIESLVRLLALADRLRRTNAAKWKLSREDWLAAVQGALNAPESRPSDRETVAEAIRLTHKAVRRLANSGEARLCSLITSRHPDSSLEGQRYYEDLELAHQWLTTLRELESAYQGNVPRD
jgi:hypothetical protein